MVVFWEIAAHSAYDMFSKYKYLIVNLVFPTSVFLEWGFLSDCACQLVPLHYKLLVYFVRHCIMVTIDLGILLIRHFLSHPSDSYC